MHLLMHTVQQIAKKINVLIPVLFMFLTGFSGLFLVFYCQKKLLSFFLFP